MITVIAEMGHQQPPIPVATDNAAENNIVNGTENKKFREIDMRFYWVRGIIRQKNFHLFWE